MAGGCFWHVGAFNRNGISGSGGIGELLVESLLDPKPDDYVRNLIPDRFTETSWNWDEARRQATHVHETCYGV